MRQRERRRPAAPAARERALAALATVRDPELDEPITALGFVERVEAGPRAVRVRLRLPTYFCAPSFAYLMAADARAAVQRAVGGGVEVTVQLADHFAAGEVTRAVTEGRGFEAAFGDQAGGGLEELRARFARKAFMARQGRLARRLLDAGLSEEELGRVRLADLPAGGETEQYLARRAELGLDTSGAAPFAVDPDGRPLPPATLAAYLRFARTIGVSIEANAELCRGLLRARYGPGAGKEATG